MADSAPRLVRFLGAFAAGIFAGSSWALNFGQIQALADKNVPPRGLVSQFRIWNGHQSGFQSVTALSTIGLTMGHTLWALVTKHSINYNFLTSGLIMTLLIPVSTAFLRPIIEVFLTIPDNEIASHGSELRQLVLRYHSFQWLRIAAGSAAFGVLLLEPFRK